MIGNKVVKTAKGTCGENAYYHLNEDNTKLTIYGIGNMTDYGRYEKNAAGEGIGLDGYLTKAPWGTFWNVMKEVKIGYGIIYLGTYTFQSCTTIESIQLPETLLRIGESAIDRTINLKELELPPNLREIGQWGIHRCDSLEKIIIPGSVTFCDDNSFSYNYGLETVVIGKGLTTISYRMFY